MYIVGVGGTLRPGSSSELALRTALAAAEGEGATTACFAGPELDLPLYNPADPERTPAAAALVAALREADGVIIASPGYHGTVSGLVKNALDYVEDLVQDDRVYFDGLPVGCIGLAFGWQASVNTLRTLRDVVHSLRGLPTPYGAALNSSAPLFAEGGCVDEGARASLEQVGVQVAHLASILASGRAAVAAAV